MVVYKICMVFGSLLKCCSWIDDLFSEHSFIMLQLRGDGLKKSYDICCSNFNQDAETPLPPLPTHFIVHIFFKSLMVSSV